MTFVGTPRSCLSLSREQGRPTAWHPALALPAVSQPARHNRAPERRSQALGRRFRLHRRARRCDDLLFSAPSLEPPGGSMAPTIESALPGREPADSARNADDRQACVRPGRHRLRGTASTRAVGCSCWRPSTPSASAAARYPCDRPSMTSWRRSLVRVRAASGRRATSAHRSRTLWPRPSLATSTSTTCAIALPPVPSSGRSLQALQTILGHQKIKTRKK
jgi:hypothetical protein